MQVNHQSDAHTPSDLKIRQRPQSVPALAADPVSRNKRDELTLGGQPEQKASNPFQLVY